jgi:hypothetical protein
MLQYARCYSALPFCYLLRWLLALTGPSWLSLEKSWPTSTLCPYLSHAESILVTVGALLATPCHLADNTVDDKFTNYSARGIWSKRWCDENGVVKQCHVSQFEEPSTLLQDTT